MGSGVLEGDEANTPPGLLPLAPDHPDAALVLHDGDIDDEYEVEREPIARGKFAAVRRARHRLTGQIFAAKYVRRRRRAKTIEAEAEARHEVAVLVLGRNNAHIAHLHRVYQTRQEYIILLEFGAGGDLQKLLDEDVNLKEDDIRALMVQVLTGLHFLHSNRIAHLDIKPQNLIMMGTSISEGVKLVDFGLSRVISQETELTQIMGTPDYVAPEVINFEPVGLATDMWSIGVLAYVFLCGCTPFGGDNDQETFVNITQAEYDFPDDLFGKVSEEAKDFISCLLLKKTSERLRIEECFNHPWLCPSVISTVYPSEPPGLYTLPESDTGECVFLPDSAYSSSDSNNGSPTFQDQAKTTNFTSSLTVSSLCHCPIPEEHHHQQQQQPDHQTNVQISRIAAAAAMLNSNKRLRSRGSYMSVDMEENLKAVRRQRLRSTRRASLVIDDPRQTSTIQVIDDPRLYERKAKNVRSMCNYQSLLNLNQHEILDNRMSFNNEYNKTSSNILRHAESFDCGIGSNLYEWNDYNDDNQLNQSLNNIDPDSIPGISKPWQKICTGSVLRAVNQLTHKKSPKKKISQSKSDLSNSQNDQGNCRREIIQNVDIHSPKSELRKSKSELRASKAELRASRTDIRSPKSEVRGSKSDIRSSKHDLRGSKNDLRNSKSFQNELKSSISDIRSSKSDLRRSKTDLRSSGHALSSWETEFALSRLDMSLSRLDLAHEQLNREEEMERSDTFRGDLTLPRRRLNRASLAPLLRGNALHMSFRVSKASRDHC